MGSCRCGVLSGRDCVGKGCIVRGWRSCCLVEMEIGDRRQATCEFIAVFIDTWKNKSMG